MTGPKDSGWGGVLAAITRGHRGLLARSGGAWVVRGPTGTSRGSFLSSGAVETAGRGRPQKASGSNGGVNLDFETMTWLASDEASVRVNAPEDKRVVHCLVFLKHVSAAFLEDHAKLRHLQPTKSKIGIALGGSVLWDPKDSR